MRVLFLYVSTNMSRDGDLWYYDEGLATAAAVLRQRGHDAVLRMVGPAQDEAGLADWVTEQAAGERVLLCFLTSIHFSACSKSAAAGSEHGRPRASSTRPSSPPIRRPRMGRRGSPRPFTRSVLSDVGPSATAATSPASARPCTPSGSTATVTRARRRGATIVPSEAPSDSTALRTCTNRLR